VWQILSTELVYDCGQSLNPLADIGQIEGAFIQGVGFYTTEEVVYDNQGMVSQKVGSIHVSHCNCRNRSSYRCRGSCIRVCGANDVSMCGLQLLSAGTWDYKPPSAFDIPIDFKVGHPFTTYILGSIAALSRTRVTTAWPLFVEQVLNKRVSVSLVV
jgi:hypothetical protein